MNIKAISKKRLKDRFAVNYNPFTGEGSPVERFEFTYTINNETHKIFLPKTLDKNKFIQTFNGQNVNAIIEQLYGYCNDNLIEEFNLTLYNTRIKEDFEYWAATAVYIKDRMSGLDVPFILKNPQRKILGVLEHERMNNRPIRIILLKSRQLGGSTLVQIYGAWIQALHKTGWNMAICAQQESQAINIRAMYDRLTLNYPDFAGELKMSNWKRTKHKYIEGRDGIIFIGSAEKPNALRSTALKLVHMSEIAFWGTTDNKTPQDLAITLTSGVPAEPLTMIVMESTANGIGNYFHQQWLNAINNESIYKSIFIAWYEDEDNILSENDIKNMPLFTNNGIYNFTDLFNKLTEYEKYLWDIGCSLEQIAWYRNKKAELGDSEWRMKEEYPSTWQEAFQATGQRVFPVTYVDKMRQYIKPPIFIGDIYPLNKKYQVALDAPALLPDSKGLLKVWIMPPDKDEVLVTDRFLVSIDIGGRSSRSDYSVIRVFDRYWMHTPDGVPEIAATWKGHIDHDLLAWKAAQLGKLYDNALLVFEINTIVAEKDADAGTGLTIINELAKYYPNLYFRNNIENIAPTEPKKYGFFTGGATKIMIIDFLVGALRDGYYIERDQEVINELEAYEYKGKNKYGAAAGYHDDMVMSTAIGLWVCYNDMPMPMLMNNEKYVFRNKPFVSEANF